MEPFQLAEDSPSLLKVQEWENRYPNLVVGFTTRMGGRSQHPYGTFNCALHVGDDYKDVLLNRQLLCDHLSFSFDKWTCVQQVHGNQVAIITEHEAGKGNKSQEDTIQGADGLLTREKGILLTSFYADCVPLLFIAPKEKVIGIAHAGWRGTAANIGQKMLDSLVNHYQADLDQVQVMIGPSIGGCCYEVDQRVVNGVKSVLDGESDSAFLQAAQNGKYFIDLKEVNRLLLIKGGLRADQIGCSKWCTSCSTDLFYSYRKEGGQTGRMTAYIGWREEG